MFLAAAALVLQFPLFSAVQAPAKVDQPVAVSQPAADSASAKQERSLPSDKQAADNKVLTADARLASVAFEPGRLVPEPVAAMTPIVATPNPVLVSAEPLPIVPVYAPMRDGSERWRNREWMALSIAAHGTAAFDAWSTRHVLSSMPNAEEANPLLRPFAGNSSMYVAVQVAPTVLDFVSRKMMNSDHAWMRHTWWVPQAASAVVSFTSGVHNLGVYNSR
jgi:hypothetical protein